MIPQMKPGQKYTVSNGRLRLMTDEEVRRWEEMLEEAFGALTDSTETVQETRTRLAGRLKGISVSQMIIDAR